MENKTETRKVYGRLAVGKDVYILLRPTPFEKEHTWKKEGQTYYGGYEGVPFLVAYVDERPFVFHTPHILIVNGDYHIDLYPELVEWQVVIK